jgi:trk system potassium uptake protein TrkA
VGVINRHKRKEFAVLGLGRFGMRVAEVLAENGANVLVCDNDARRIQYAAAFATQALQTDISDEDELQQLGLGNFDAVVIATGEDFEASVTAVTVAKEKGVPYIVVKAETLRQESILEKLGADRVVFPEKETGEKIAQGILNIDIMDILKRAKDYTISEMPPKEHWVGKTVAESGIRSEKILILAIKRGQQTIVPVEASEVLQRGDEMIVWKYNG